MSPREAHEPPHMDGTPLQPLKSPACPAVSTQAPGCDTELIPTPDPHPLAQQAAERKPSSQNRLFQRPPIPCRLCWRSARTLSSQLQWPPWPQAAPSDRGLDGRKSSKSGEGSSRVSSVQRLWGDRRPPQDKLSPAPAVGLNPTWSHGGGRQCHRGAAPAALSRPGRGMRWKPLPGTTHCCSTAQEFCLE